LVRDRYRLEEPLGHGGVAVVWRARDLHLDRDVAVKRLTPAALDDPAALERFHREARTIAKLAHPNIVTVHDFGFDDEAPYLVLELVRGPSLATDLNNGPLPAVRAVNIARQACGALAAAHAAGVIHRVLMAMCSSARISWV
jgi:serine/threonine-protein kinase